MWQSRRWARLLELIDRLPRDSRYTQAVSLDEEYAAMLVEKFGVNPKPSPPPMSEYSFEYEALLNITDQLQAIYIAFLGANSKKGSQVPQMKPAARPETAFEKAKHRSNQAVYERLESMLFPRRQGGKKPAQQP